MNTSLNLLQKMDNFNTYDVLTRKTDGSKWIYGNHEHAVLNIFTSELKVGEKIIVVPFVEGEDVQRTYDQGEGQALPITEFTLDIPFNAE